MKLMLLIIPTIQRIVNADGHQALEADDAGRTGSP